MRILVLFLALLVVLCGCSNQLPSTASSQQLAASSASIPTVGSNPSSTDTISQSVSGSFSPGHTSGSNEWQYDIEEGSVWEVWLLQDVDGEWAKPGQYYGVQITIPKAWHFYAYSLYSDVVNSEGDWVKIAWFTPCRVFTEPFELQETMSPIDDNYPMDILEESEFTLPNGNPAYYQLLRYTGGEGHVYSYSVEIEENVVISAAFYSIGFKPEFPKEVCEPILNSMYPVTQP